MFKQHTLPTIPKYGTYTHTLAQSTNAIYTYIQWQGRGVAQEDERGGEQQSGVG